MCGSNDSVKALRNFSGNEMILAGQLKGYFDIGKCFTAKSDIILHWVLILCLLLKLLTFNPLHINKHLLHMPL